MNRGRNFEGKEWWREENLADLAAFNLIDAEKNKFSRNLYLYRGWEKQIDKNIYLIKNDKI